MLSGSSPVCGLWRRLGAVGRLSVQVDGAFEFLAFPLGQLVKLVRLHVEHGRKLVVRQMALQTGRERAQIQSVGAEKWGQPLER